MRKNGKNACQDNAQAGSSYAKFKAELTEGGVFEVIAQARFKIFDCIEFEPKL